MREWKEFTAKYDKLQRQTMMVTITRSAYLSVSGDVIRAIGEPSHVVLLYAPEGNGAIGIQPAPEPLPPYAFVVRVNGSSFTISADRFLKAHGIPFPLYDLPVTIEDGMAVFEIPAGADR